MKEILLIDISHWFYQLLYKMPNLSSDERPTGILFGMMNKIIQHAKIFETNQFIFIFDSRKNNRKKIYPQYKEKRNKKEKTPEEKQIFKDSFAQLNYLRMKMLPELGFKNIFIQTGIESDDIIASVIQNNPEYNYVVVSNDEDLWQLLSENVRMYNTKTKKFYTVKDLKKEYNIAPEQWLEAKFYFGCKSDEVPGATGKGHKVEAALKFIKGELGENTQAYKAFMSKEGKELVERNKKLIKLPFEGTDIFKINTDWKLDIKNYIEVCDYYDFRSLLYGDQFEVWKRIMCKNNG